jgi:RHS repeat-associated protein
LVSPNASYAQVIEERAPNTTDAAGTPQLQARYVWGQGLSPLAPRDVAQGQRWQLQALLLPQRWSGFSSPTDFADGRGDRQLSLQRFRPDTRGGSGDTVNPFRYTGQQLDGDGRYYLRARFYDPGNGRFLSHDPLMGSASDPISMHRYLYAGADAVNGIDPSGEFTGTVGETLTVSMTQSQHNAMAEGRKAHIGAEVGQATRAAQNITRPYYISVKPGGGMGIPLQPLTPWETLTAFVPPSVMAAAATAVAGSLGLGTYHNAAYKSDPEEMAEDGNIVFHALDPGKGEVQSVASGLGIVRGNGNTLLNQHIRGYGANHKNNPWVSTTRIYATAVWFSIEGGKQLQPNPIVMIDLAKVSSGIHDVSTREGCIANGLDPTATSLALKHQEVTIRGGVSPDAIVGYSN